MRINKREIELENKESFIYGLVATILAIVIMFTIVLAKACEKNQSEDGIKTTVYESVETTQDHETVISSANALTNETTTEKYCRNLSEDDKYLLAKIAMAEAEGESRQTKILVILTVLNRVESDKFPNTIEDVIYQKSGGTYQFSVMGSGGRWWTTTPSDECWEAVEVVNNNTTKDLLGIFSDEFYYFESCSGESWHSRNLEFVCQSDSIRFYK